MATKKKSVIKKADVGIRANKTVPDSTAYYQGRVKKAYDLLEDAQKEKFGPGQTAYEQKFKDNIGNMLKDQRDYKTRQSTTPPLKKGGKVKAKTVCASCGKSVSKHKK